MRQMDSSTTASQATCRFSAKIVPGAHVHVVIAIKPLYFCTGAEIGVFLRVHQNDRWQGKAVMKSCTNAQTPVLTIASMQVGERADVSNLKVRIR